MTPGARLQAAMELVEAMNTESAPGDHIVRQYFRSRRYIGSKDRRAIADRIWQVVRHRARTRWLLENEFPSSRLEVLTDALSGDGISLNDIEDLCSGETYSPDPVTDDEQGALKSALARNMEEAPVHVRVECPDWLWPYMTDLYGGDAETEFAALNEEAPADLRVNTLKGAQESARDMLQEEGLAAEPMRWSPMGVRLSARTTLGNSQAYKTGLIEVQDEGSQIASLLVDAHADHEVLDFCAGAGGKTLALAAAMGGKGRIVATDIDADRLNHAKPRLKRAGIHSVTTRVLDPANTNWLHKRRKSFDRVLVDAPCSGTGAWRRQPEARWRFTPADLDRSIATQDQVLSQGGRMVKPGGRLVYVTCSLLRQENEDRVDAFLERHAHFRALSVGDVWKQVLGTRYPGRGKFLRLSPRRHGTDGFFIAVLERAMERTVASHRTAL